MKSNAAPNWARRFSYPSAFILGFQPSSVASARRRDVGQERHEPGALDGAGEHALLHGGGAGALAGQDLAVAADHLLQRLGVLVIDVGLAAGADAGDLDLGPVERLE